MDDLDARLSDLRTLPVAPLPGAAAARARGDKRTRRTRTALAATAAVAAVLAVSVVPSLTAGDRITAPPAGPAPTGPAPTAAPAGDLSLGLLDADDVGALRSGAWSSIAPPDEPTRVLPQGCDDSTAAAALESARVFLTGGPLSIEHQVIRFASPGAAQRELGRIIDSVEACDGTPWTLVGGLPGTGPDRVYGTWEQDGQTAVFALERFGPVLSAVGELQGPLDGLPLLADAAAAKLSDVIDLGPSGPAAWDVGSALLTPAEAATVEPGDWTAEPIVDQRVLDPCGALDVAPEDFAGSALQVQREAGGTTVDTHVSRFATPDAAVAALQSYRTAVLDCPSETPGQVTTVTYELLTDEADRLVVREVIGCPGCLPSPSYAVVVQDGTGLVTVRVAVGEDGDPGPGLAEQYGALAQDRLALVVPD